MRVCELVDDTPYDFDIKVVLKTFGLMSKVNLNIKEEAIRTEHKVLVRNKQTQPLLRKLDSALIPCTHREWLNKRGIEVERAYSLDYEILNLQDMLDLYIIPGDHIVDRFGIKPIEGPVFDDRRNGKLFGVCIRNIATDLNYASAEKFTISNFGWYLNGYDLSGPNDEVYIVEGVFDAIAMRKSGFNAIAIASACPTPFQLACIMYKFNNIKLCLDNDLFGAIGAFMTHEATGFPIYQTELKDPGSYHDSNVKLVEIQADELKYRLDHEIAEYNMSDRKPRPMSYN
jgi:hypothetical protein